MAKETKAKLAFERLFGAGGEKDETQRERDFFRKSILDFVAADAKQLQRRLGQTDRRKIEEYFTSVRELETRIARAEADEKAARPDYKIPENAGDRKQQIRLMYDLIVLAFQTDTTRIATFMLGNAGSNASYPMVGVNDGHHSISHHRNEEGKVSKLRQIDRFFVDQFAYFLGKLKAVEENGSTLLDNSMIVYGSGLGDGNRHDHAGLPVLLAGRGGGRVKTGSHIKLSSETPLNNLFVSMLSIAGAKVEKVGDSSGKLGLS
jgi:hypothetical protein